MTLKIDRIGSKILSVMPLDPISLIELVRNFSNNYTFDWQAIKEYYKEQQLDIVPKNSIGYIQDQLKILADKEYVFNSPEQTFFSVWKINPEKLVKDESVTINLPKSMTKLLRNLSDNNLDSIVNIALTYYIMQRHFKSFNQSDYIKIIIVDNFGSDAFKKEKLLPLLKNAGINHMIDISLESYCINGIANKDRFLIKLPDGSFKINSKLE